MLVQKRTLLLLAGVVWLFAGYNIARIGWISYETKQAAWHFFDQKSFWLMAGMITLVSS